MVPDKMLFSARNHSYWMATNVFREQANNVNPSQYDFLRLPFDCTTSARYWMATNQKHGYNECDL